MMTENLLEQVANLKDQNYWLKVELEGLKQTNSMIKRSKELRLYESKFAFSIFEL